MYDFTNASASSLHSRDNSNIRYTGSAAPIGINTTPFNRCITLVDCEGQSIVVIDANGIMRVNVEANDDNARKFIELVNRHLEVKEIVIQPSTGIQS